MKKEEGETPIRQWIWNFLCLILKYASISKRISGEIKELFILEIDVWIHLESIKTNME